MTRLEALQASAAAYNLATPGRRIHWRDVSVLITNNPTGLTIAFEGTDPRNVFNLIRDADVMPKRDHPDLGLVPAGPAVAADGLFPLLWDAIGDAPYDATGHSLGGWIAAIWAGRMRIAGRPPRSLVPCDPPKPGEDKLSAVLADVPGEVLIFNGSIVSHWPFWQFRQFRTPPVLIGDWSGDWITAHSIERAVAWEAGRRWRLDYRNCALLIANAG